MHFSVFFRIFWRIWVDSGWFLGGFWVDFGWLLGGFWVALKGFEGI